MYDLGQRAKFLKKDNDNLLFFRYALLLNYTVVKRHSVVFQFYNKNISWNEASQICKTMGGYLPYFTSRPDLEEILAIFKLSQDIPPIVQIFIGLKYDSSQVSYYFYATYHQGYLLRLELWYPT